MDAPIRAPFLLRNTPGRPLVVVVHATRKYDRQASVRQPIQQTLEHLAPVCNILEIEEMIGPSYLDLPSELKTSFEAAGNLLHQEFFADRAELIDSANTFIFVGGRANRCLLNAFLSIMIAKLSPLEQIFAEHSSIMNPQRSLPELLTLARREDADRLSFHFNCDAIYPSHHDFRGISSDADVLNWSPNIAFFVMAATYSRNRQLLKNSGLNIQDYVNGRRMPRAVSSGGATSRKIDLFYWSSLREMLKPSPPGNSL